MIGSKGVISILTSLERSVHPIILTQVFFLFVSSPTHFKLMFGLPRIPAVTMVLPQAATSVPLMLTRKACASSLNKHSNPSTECPPPTFTWCLNVFCLLPHPSCNLLYIIRVNIPCKASNFRTGRPGPSEQVKEYRTFLTCKPSPASFLSPPQSFLIDAGL